MRGEQMDCKEKEMDTAGQEYLSWPFPVHSGFHGATGGQQGGVGGVTGLQERGCNVHDVKMPHPLAGQTKVFQGTHKTSDLPESTVNAIVYIKISNCSMADTRYMNTKTNSYFIPAQCKLGAKKVYIEISKENPA